MIRDLSNGPPSAADRQIAGLPGASAAPTDDRRLVHTSRVGALFPIYFKNLALTLITLGFYRFWAKTNVRRFLWSQTRFLDDPLVYLGRPAELLSGFLLVLALVLLPLALLSYFVAPEIIKTGEEMAGMAGLFMLGILPVLILLPFLLGVALYAARRYRLSRTAWRGIRGAMTGSAWNYGLLSIWCWFLTIISLGWYFPWMRMRLARRRITNSYFGDQKFTFSGNGREMLGTYFVFMFLGGIGASIAEVVASKFIFADQASWVSAGIAWLMFLLYRSRELAYIAGHSALGDLKFRYTYSDWLYIRFILGNLLISLASLTTGWVFLQRRQFQFQQRFLGFEGGLDFARLGQSGESETPTGEGLADVLDQGFEIGLDVGF